MNVPTKTEILKELRRELSMRNGVYPKWIKSGRHHPTDAAHRIACLAAVCSDFKQRNFGSQPRLDI